GGQHHVAAAAAVAAVGPAPRPVLLAVERGHPVTAAPGGHLDGGLVDEHQSTSRAAMQRRPDRDRGGHWAARGVSIAARGPGGGGGSRRGAAPWSMLACLRPRRVG